MISVYGQGGSPIYDNKLLTGGYIWSQIENPDAFPDIKLNIGVALEGANENELVLNDASVTYVAPKADIVIGRALSAAGRLHQDLTDAGAPGAGSDNQNFSFWRTGGMSANVAQRVTAPFTARTVIYAKPANGFEIGASYTPYISDENPLGYRFFSDSPARDEATFAFLWSRRFGERFVGLSGGGGVARSEEKGRLSFYQGSLHYQRPRSGRLNGYRRYEFVFGLMRAEQRNDGFSGPEKETRLGFQIVDRYGRFTVSYFSQTRRAEEPSNRPRQRRELETIMQTDVGNGVSYDIADGLTVGAEYGVRFRRAGEDGFLFALGFSVDF